MVGVLIAISGEKTKKKLGISPDFHGGFPW
jgi:hypothetical protein